MSSASDTPFLVSSKHGLVALLLIGLVLAVYANAVPHPFVHDDVVFIQNNPSLGRFDDVRDIFIPAPRAGSQIVNPYYRPLLDIVYKLEYRLFGLDPRGFHLFNVAVHAGNTFFVYVLLFLVTSRMGLAAVAATLFAVHPVQSEAVACVSGISNLIFAFFSLASLIFFISAARNFRSYTALLMYFLSLSCFGAALFAKEQAILTVFLATLLDACFPVREDPRVLRRRLRVLGFWIVAAGYLFWRQSLLGAAITPGGAETAEANLRLLAIPRLILTYLGTVFFPVDLHYYRSLDILQPFGMSWLALALIVGAGGLLIRRLQGPARRWAAFGALWFWFALLPTLNLVPLVNEYSLVLAAEHFLYLAVIGLFLAVLLIGETLLQRLFPQDQAGLKSLLVAFVLVLSIGVTVRQNTFWRGEVALFERTVRFEPEFGRGHILLGKAYYFDRQYGKAREEFLRAIAILRRHADRAQDPRVRDFYRGFIKGAHFDLAHVFEAQGRYSEAVASYAQALAIDPRDGVLHNNLGVALLQLGDLEHATGHFRDAFNLDPSDLRAATNLANGLFMLGRSQEGLRVLQQVYEKGDSPSPNSGKSLQEKGN